MTYPNRRIERAAALLLVGALGCAAKSAATHAPADAAAGSPGAPPPAATLDAASEADDDYVAYADEAPAELEEAAAPEAEIAGADGSAAQARRTAARDRRADRRAKRRAKQSERQAVATQQPAPQPGSAAIATDPGGTPTIAQPPPAPTDFDTEAYDHIAENDFVAVADDPLSTFSIDVDTASYANVRRFLREGRLPPPGAVRIEELVNYFDYAYAQPRGEHPFSITAEVAACPWNTDHRLVHVGLQGKDIAAGKVPARNLVFLIDVSGSMSSQDKLPLLKHGLGMLADQIRPRDRVSIVVYAGASGVVLAPTANRTEIKTALARLQSGGSTNGGAGIELAYELAQRSFERGGINRVILASDGDFNVGVTNRGDLIRLIEQKRKSGVFLSVLGFGTGNLQDATMEQLADKGNGNYAYIDSAKEAHKVLVEQASSTLVTIAKDVKLQLEFNPTQVESYRLVGYENRKLAHEDFNDDTKDAGEIGAGHTVTALYEIVPTGSGRTKGKVDALKYQRKSSLSAAAGSGEVLNVKIRYKRPDGNRSRLLSVPVRDFERPLSQSSTDFRFSAAVAEFGMLLRGSKHVGNATFADAHDLARNARGKDAHGRRSELVELIERAADLSGQRAAMRRAK
jgi:Ca-activated chloride channel family protein